MPLRQAWVSNKTWSQKQTQHSKRRCRGERGEGTGEGPHELAAVVRHGVSHSHTQALWHGWLWIDEVSAADPRCPNFQTQLWSLGLQLPPHTHTSLTTLVGLCQLPEVSSHQNCFWISSQAIHLLLRQTGNRWKDSFIIRKMLGLTGSKPHLRLDCRGNFGDDCHWDTRSLLSQRALEETHTEKVCSPACRLIM